MTAAHCLVLYGFHLVHSFAFVNVSSKFLYLFFLCSKTITLTSSHDIDIVVGTNTWNSGGTHYDINDIIVHERFNLSMLLNDIALIRVEKPIKFNERVQPIKYSAKEVQPHTKLQTTGWGLLKVLEFIHSFLDFHYR